MVADRAVIDPRADLREALAVTAGSDPATLYAHWYTRLGGAPRRAPSAPAAADTAATANLVDAYRAAHHGTGRWCAGWTAAQVSNRGRVVAVRADERQVVDRVDVVGTRRPCLAVRPGDPVRITARRDSLSEDGSSWITWGPGWTVGSVSAGSVRCYWNVRPDAVLRFVEVLTPLVTEAPVALKLPADPTALDRADTAVLYIPGAALAAVGGRVRDLYPALSVTLDEHVPRLTLRLAAGWSVAEDPATGESFGEHRCRLLAAAIADARRIAPASPEEQLGIVVDELRASGLDPGRLHLNPGSDADYGWLAR